MPAYWRTVVPHLTHSLAQAQIAANGAEVALYNGLTENEGPVGARRI